MARTDQRYVPVALFVIALVLLAARVAHQTTKSTPPAKKKNDLVSWVTPAEGLQLAKTTNKPLVYNFTADWCQPCHLLEAAVFRDPELARTINERFIPVLVVDRQQEEGRNSEEVAALQLRYGVQGFPTIVFADATGERARMEGFRGREHFQQVMESVR
jgi:thiol:disulfide interchange protein